MTQVYLSVESYQSASSSQKQAEATHQFYCSDNLPLQRRCYFQLRAISQLAAAKSRLSKAQQSLEKSHGPSGQRMRHLHGNFCPEMAMYVTTSNEVTRCLHVCMLACCLLVAWLVRLAYLPAIWLACLPASLPASLLAYLPACLLA